MASTSLAGARLVVVGASAGIGRAFAVRAVAEGAEVVLAARRTDRLAEVVAEAGGGTPVTADLRSPADCERLAAVAAERLGTVDALVCSAGLAPLQRFADTTVEDWRAVLETNAVGVHQLIRACLPVLDPAAVVAALSSESVVAPRSGLGAYATSKAALEQLLACWRVERPGVRFCCVAVGATFPTEFGDGFEPTLLDATLRDWAVRGLLQEQMMAPEDVAEVLAGVLATALACPGVGLERLVLRSPSAVVGTTGEVVGLRPPVAAGSPE